MATQSLLEELVVDYDQLYKTTTTQIENLKNGNFEKYSVIIDLITSKIEEISSCIQDMKQEILEIRNNESKKQWNEKINKYKNNLKSLKEEFNKAKRQSVKARDNCASGANSNGNIKAETLAASTMKTEQQNTEMLKEISRTLHNTEEEAIGISEKLYDDRNKIEKIHNTVNESNGLLGKMETIVKRMDRRAKMMKWFV